MFEPVNRYLLVEMPKAPEETVRPSIVLPDDYNTPQESHLAVSVLKAAQDVRFKLPSEAKVIVDRSMIEEINIGGTIYNVILDNYVVGIID